MTEKIYNAGIYCRVSRDDERDGASVSIENQKTMLTQYVLERGWNLIDCYIDDGYSGLDFQRPGVQRLLEDAASGRINVILVKDLSRFGRNYLAFGQYTDYFFPSVGCRFIAVNNGIDTENEAGSNDFMRLLNLFNEMKCLHEDKNNGVISDSVFTLLMKKYQEEHAQRMGSVQRLSDRIDALRENLNCDSSDPEQIKCYTEIAELDAPLLRSLIQRIEVGEVKDENGECVRDIRIIYRFAEY